MHPILLIAYTFVTLSVLMYVVILVLNVRRRFSPNLNKKRILFVTAHPDDECMFFGPAIVDMSQDCEIYLLCFSSGNFYKQGEVRKLELLACCKILGIPPDNVELLDISSLPDNPDVDWNVKILCQNIEHFSKHVDANAIFTFDKDGVSNHRNHKALYNAIRNLSSRPARPGFLGYYVLETVSIWRKYISLMDLPYSILSGKNYFISTPNSIIKAQKAMYAHWSQFVWFRVLYILFSRYMIINTFQEIKQT
ncbi:N-acetylglucosaminyl-phosphatidylinositol de-N-acetylase-like [Gigantopelta aegis]|uniref:N-acetylglucosaminyl-phosphatidylinositol de-N-acetylase-like n=1 Tax=Gigantopelta aegis TaxID=1735272 RepID=UPI001B88CCC4|nr:N-acetylglucosaminyl-phosphatidylinositol de-N-acetylase-like [Gigantopelta aegis]